ncbi:MAG TPA: SNF2-related protein, partial [Anaerolineae bacterium]|nr:SNF2-related protein [Anaerolineae bacterium]
MDKLAPLGSGGLFHDMGAGKTRTALELLRVWGTKRVLILAPKSVVRVWPAEFAKHLSEPWRVVALDSGPVAKRAKTAWVENLCAEADGRHLAVVVNYDSLVHRPMPETLETLQWDALVLDESHRCKAPRGKTARTVAALARRIPHRLALTGTPMPHSPLDVWSQMQVVCPGLLPDRYAVFEGRYAI